MIRLTRLNGTQFYLNADHIQSVESTPDSHIQLSNGQQYVVCESDDEIAELMVAYQQRVRNALIPGNVSPLRRHAP